MLGAVFRLYAKGFRSKAQKGHSRTTGRRPHPSSADICFCIAAEQCHPPCSFRLSTMPPPGISRRASTERRRSPSSIATLPHAWHSKGLLRFMAKKVSKRAAKRSRALLDLSASCSQTRLCMFAALQAVQIGAFDRCVYFQRVITAILLLPIFHHTLITRHFGV